MLSTAANTPHKSAAQLIATTTGEATCIHRMQRRLERSQCNGLGQKLHCLNTKPKNKHESENDKRIENIGSMKTIPDSGFIS
ncbi:unnamed protein product [Litomosoides sigmodontis]|uniref:Uncharacterized protein n=1 Tax=Litomosoides sigmodontis TaxID=42156 RepID=A0A3P6V0J8_LITSI|nr:unnamed protein product [Litomosoides sigmodontis]